MILMALLCVAVNSRGPMWYIKALQHIAYIAYGIWYMVYSIWYMIHKDPTNHGLGTAPDSQQFAILGSQLLEIVKQVFNIALSMNPIHKHYVQTRSYSYLHPCMNRQV